MKKEAESRRENRFGDLRKNREIFSKTAVFAVAAEGEIRYNKKAGKKHSDHTGREAFR